MHIRASARQAKKAVQRAPGAGARVLDLRNRAAVLTQLQHVADNSARTRQLQSYRRLAQSRTALPAVQRMPVDEVQGLSHAELLIYRDWIEWAKVYGGHDKSEAAVLESYTLAGLQGALSAYTTDPWRRYIAMFAAMANAGSVPMEMYQIMRFDDIAQVKDPGLALDFSRLAGIKELGLDDLGTQLNTWKDVVEPRGYPYPFANIGDFNTFKGLIAQLVQTLGLQPSAIRVQGSSLRKPNPGDIDIGVMLNGDEFRRIGVMLSSADTSNRAKGQTKKALEKGKIDPRQLSFLTRIAGGNVTRIFELAKAAAQAGGIELDVQVSAILIGSGFDSSPCLDF